MKTRASLAVGMGVLTPIAMAQEPAPTPTALHVGHVWDCSRLTNNVNHAVAKSAPTIHDVELVIRNKPSLATVHAHWSNCA